jgi:hypothetical protein
VSPLVNSPRNDAPDDPALLRSLFPHNRLPADDYRTRKH